MPEPLTLIGVGGGTITLGMYLARRFFDAAKEVADVALGFFALVLSLPVLVICAVVIKLSDGGPVFFTQFRAGKDGQPFRIYKLRTMRMGAEQQTGAVWAEKGDPRVLPACRWMRRCHLDELPQILNVIKGDMSLVGPRPERPEILEKLQRSYPNLADRLAVRPGITGLAQIRNGYDTTPEAFGAKLEADLEYIRRRCVMLDLHILGATAARFLGDRHAH